MFFLYRMRRRPKRNFKHRMNHILFSAEGKCDVDTLHEFRMVGFVPLSVGKIGTRSFLYGLFRDEKNDASLLSQVQKDTELLNIVSAFSSYCGGKDADVQMCFIPDGESEKDASWCFGMIKTVVICRKKIGKRKTSKKVKDGYVKNIC
ncbi:highly derived D5-like helicase-primase [Brazilian marseillevirus]|uniref:highly derived D5-like helicase-primase n=1 Tax=Brazilian marseillevirus TaxID=1813599 RepID=UPI0007818262|nr:highly derived D5-like helicase-primase [Brazilian marseillevirus]AMQ10590.1 highly derived D5-like helicase-primase [Brazilian marseillevirus]